MKINGKDIYNPSKRRLEEYQESLEAEKKRIKVDDSNNKNNSHPPPPPPPPPPTLSIPPETALLTPKLLSFSSLNINSNAPRCFFEKPLTPRIKIYCTAHMVYFPNGLCHSCNSVRSNFVRFNERLLYVDAKKYNAKKISFLIK